MKKSIVFLLIIFPFWCFAQSKKASANPEEIVRKQLEAYNKRDLQAFVACYSDSVKTYDFPDQLKHSGKKEFRDAYKKVFDKYPNLHCEVVKRMIKGNIIIDEEKLTGRAEGETFYAIVIYEVNNGLIEKVYFITKE